MAQRLGLRPSGINSSLLGAADFGGSTSDKIWDANHSAKVDGSRAMSEELNGWLGLEASKPVQIAMTLPVSVPN